MNNTELLFVRACKSLSPKMRVEGVYKRFYLSCGDPTVHIVEILVDICDKYCPIQTTNLINSLNPSNYFGYTANANFFDRCLDILISHIGLTEIKNFPEYIAPAIFRNK